MSAANNAKGKGFERDAANYATRRLHDAGVLPPDQKVHRRAALGLPEDEGDLFGIPYTAVQCKNTTRIDLTVVDQAAEQARRRGLPVGVLLQKRRMRPISESYVAMSYDTYLDLVITIAKERAR